MAQNDEAIDRAALYLLNNVGWSGALRQLGGARRSDLARLACALHARCAADYAAAIEHALRSCDRLEDALAGFVDKQLDWAVGHPEEAQLLFMTARDLPLRADADAPQSELRRRLVEWIGGLVARGELPRGTERRAWNLLQPGERMIRRWLCAQAPDPRSAREELLEEICRLLWTPIHPDVFW